MKKQFVMTIGLLMAAMTAMAINYPTYKPSSSNRQMPTQQTTSQSQDVLPIGGYSTVAIGGTTTYGEGSAISGYSSGPRRAVWNGEGDPNEGDTWNSPEGTLVWSEAAGGWVKSDTQLDNAGNPMPVGSPILPMLLFALMAGGAIALRRRQAQA